jgi:hypothetical protein
LLDDDLPLLGVVRLLCGLFPLLRLLRVESRLMLRL